MARLDFFTKHLRRHWLTAVLWILGFVFLGGLFFAHEKPFARDWLCDLIKSWAPIANGDAFAKIFYDLSIGGFTSLMFFVLLIKIPEWKKRNRLKRSLAR